ncbi:succinate--CoA ligase subunit alpha [Sulfuracidifex tepidarius]|uniref:Succinate--CoA ligase [ADP-forming] subunit alpha n=1 Tax=Sulfuracidifex tepidarius TaxID=1294262 RepID=A0A510E6N3_9CREN|nr:succinate--CoA ligase subunit alpha [Sulfuracidifex tepidarius]BBG25293.1 Succinate--CoA ligase [ADP-forming] subunit alpha [Sulfuracidifex tepidarius]BBG28087.1 Succinate--CoA ligase [ADP-forming] subunit alpha [Sulfuracidifex tepidarius]
MNKDTKVLVQGITGREGSFHTRLMKSYSTKIAAGTSPGKGGTQVEGIPVYDTVEEAVKEHEIDASIIFVPASNAADAIVEAADSNIKLIVTITEHIPVIETLRAVRYAKSRGSSVIGPNSPGLIAPDETMIGIMPSRAFRKGRVGIISRSGTLTYEVAEVLKDRGQSLVVGIGGDPIIGSSMLDLAKEMEADPQTDSIVVIGEIGGIMEERLASAIARGEIKKKVVAYMAGMTAPKEKRMGHAGAVVYMGMGTFQSKIEAFKRANVKVAKTPYEIPEMI